MRPLKEVLSEVGLKGFRVDLNRFAAEKALQVEQAHRLQQLLNVEAGRPVDIDSNRDVARLLFEERGNVPSVFGKTQPSVAIDVLSSLQDPICKTLIEYKRVVAVLKYFRTAEKYIVGSRIPYKFEVDKAANFRIYAKEPSVMSFPAPIRKSIVPEDGKKFIHADYKREELAIIAWASCQESFIKDLRDGVDIFHDIAKHYGFDRAKVKLAIYAFFYGAEVRNIAFKVGVSEQEVVDSLRYFTDRYPLMVDYIVGLRKQVADTGVSQTLVWPHKYEVDKSDLEKSIRRGVNFVVSGTAALILRDLIVRIDEHPQLDFKLCTHDSVLVEVDSSNVMACGLELEKLMVNYLDKNSLLVEMRSGDSWFDAWNPEGEESDAIFESF